MTIEIGPYSFEHSSYDAFGDVGYLRLEAGQEVVGFYDSPEGHVFFAPLDQPDSEEVVGIDFHSPREQLEAQGRVIVTMPDGQRLEVPEIEKLVSA